MKIHRRFLPLFLLGAVIAGCDIEPIDPSEIVTLTGLVVSRETGQPIAGATVTTLPATATAITGPDGRFSLTPVPGGYYTLSASAPGYRTASLEIAARSTRPPDTLRLRDSIPHTGLVAYYPLDGTAIDASGRGRHGSATATVSTSDRFGDLDGAMLFDGTRSRITVANTSELNFAGAQSFTIVAWVRFSALQTSRPAIVAKGSGASHLVGYELRINGGKAESEVGTTLGPVSARNERFINDNRWHMLGFVASRRDGRVNFYVDGDLVDFTSSTFIAGDVSSSADLVIGRGAVTGAYFSGAIDDVRLFNRQLDDEDFRVLYHERGFD
jgi:hypothetical protein